MVWRVRSRSPQWLGCQGAAGSQTDLAVRDRFCRFRRPMKNTCWQERHGAAANLFIEAQALSDGAESLSWVGLVGMGALLRREVRERSGGGDSVCPRGTSLRETILGETLLRFLGNSAVIGGIGGCLAWLTGVVSLGATGLILTLAAWMIFWCVRRASWAWPMLLTNLCVCGLILSVFSATGMEFEVGQTGQPFGLQAVLRPHPSWVVWVLVPLLALDIFDQVIIRFWRRRTSE